MGLTKNYSQLFLEAVKVFRLYKEVSDAKREAVGDVENAAQPLGPKITELFDDATE